MESHKPVGAISVVSKPLNTGSPSTSLQQERRESLMRAVKAFISQSFSDEQRKLKGERTAPPRTYGFDEDSVADSVVYGTDRPVVVSTNRAQLSFYVSTTAFHPNSQAKSLP